jgi:hypothetical protein
MVREWIRLELAVCFTASAISEIAWVEEVVLLHHLNDIVSLENYVVYKKVEIVEKISTDSCLSNIVYNTSVAISSVWVKFCEFTL